MAVDPFSSGYFFLYDGPMFGGKSTEAHAKMAYLAKGRHAEKKCLMVKVDNRWDKGDGSVTVRNHNGIDYSGSFPSIKLSLVELLNYDYTDYDIIWFDEIHLPLKKIEIEEGREMNKLYEDRVYSLIYNLVYRMKKIVFATMNDFWHDGEPVIISVKLKKIATCTQTFRARCDKCGSYDATMSMKLNQAGETTIVEEGGSETWCAVCPRCWPGRPEQPENTLKTWMSDELVPEGCIFTHYGKYYCVTTLLLWLNKAKKPIVTVPLDSVTEQLCYACWDHDHRAIRPMEVMEDPTSCMKNWNRIISADLSYPIVIMNIKQKNIIVDGVHRVCKAAKLNKKTIACVQVTLPELERFRMLAPYETY